MIIIPIESKNSIGIFNTARVIKKEEEWNE